MSPASCCKLRSCAQVPAPLRNPPLSNSNMQKIRNTKCEIQKFKSENFKLEAALLRTFHPNPSKDLCHPAWFSPVLYSGQFCDRQLLYSRPRAHIYEVGRHTSVRSLPKSGSRLLHINSRRSCSHSHVPAGSVGYWYQYGGSITICRPSSSPC